MDAGPIEGLAKMRTASRTSCGPMHRWATNGPITDLTNSFGAP